MKLTPAAATRTSTSPGPGDGVGQVVQAQDLGSAGGGGTDGSHVGATYPAAAVAAGPRPGAACATRRDSRSPACMFMHMSFSVAVAGASGYAGGEALRLLLAPPGGADRRADGPRQRRRPPLGEHHPHLVALADRVLAADRRPRRSPGTTSSSSGCRTARRARSPPSSATTSSCSTSGADHRLTDAAAWTAFYGGDHAGSWPYGLPELLHAGETTASAQRAALAGARRVAVPGCNVTAVTLGLQPGIAAGVVEPTDLVAVLANGYSGAGKALKPHLLAAEALGAAQPYGVGGVHRHIPEIEQNLQVAGAPAGSVTISFTPTLVPMSRGILATATARLAPGVDAASGPRRVGGRVRRRAVRAPAPGHVLGGAAVADDGRGPRRQHRARPGRGRRAGGSGRHRHRDRQPRQGHRGRRACRASTSRSACPRRWG